MARSCGVLEHADDEMREEEEEDDDASHVKLSPISSHQPLTSPHIITLNPFRAAPSSVLRKACVILNM